MDFNFSEALRRLGPDAAFRIINQARPPAEYLFDSLLPERNEFSYETGTGGMTIVTTMAGLANMDSPYPETGMIHSSDFNESTLKIANRSGLSEHAIRKMQEMLMRLAIKNTPTTPVIMNEILNFTNKILVQAHMDTTEWLRGQALSSGRIDWTFGNITVAVDYGIPAGNKLTARTGNDGYGGSTSKFWVDVTAARRLLKNNVRAFIAHSNTIDAIRYNEENGLVAISEVGGVTTFKRKQSIVGSDGNVDFISPDTADVIKLIAYDLEGEVYDPTTAGRTLKIPFMPVGKLIAIGNNSGTQYVVGAGATPPVENALGFTHIAPTVEGGGDPGRWAQVYVPEGAPYTIEGRAVSNLLPVIEAPEKIVILTTEVA